jgi:hypothetical protein
MDHDKISRRTQVTVFCGQFTIRFEAVEDAIEIGRVPRPVYSVASIINEFRVGRQHSEVCGKRP